VIVECEQKQELAVEVCARLERRELVENEESSSRVKRARRQRAASRERVVNREKEESGGELFDGARCGRLMASGARLGVKMPAR
jgi:hypothetical protein